MQVEQGLDDLVPGGRKDIDMSSAGSATPGPLKESSLPPICGFPGIRHSHLHTVYDAFTLKWQS